MLGSNRNTDIVMTILNKNNWMQIHLSTSFKLIYTCMKHQKIHCDSQDGLICEGVNKGILSKSFSIVEAMWSRNQILDVLCSGREWTETRSRDRRPNHRATRMEIRGFKEFKSEKKSLISGESAGISNISKPTLPDLSLAEMTYAHQSTHTSLTDALWDGAS